MIDLRLLLCGLVAWGAVGVTVTVAGDGRAGIALGVGIVLAGVGILTLLVRVLPLWWGAVLVVGGAGVVAAALQVAAWTDPQVTAVFRDDVVVTAGVHGTVERVDTSNGPVWAPASRWRLLVGATTIEGAAGAIRVDLPVVLETGDPEVAAALPPPGSRIEVRGTTIPTPGSTRAIGIVRIDSAPRLTAPPGWVDGITNRMREALLIAVSDVSPAAGGIVAGLAIGDESRLPEQTRIDMRESGLAHLMAVSGGNVAIVVGAVFLLAGLLGVGLRGRVAMSLVVLVGYLILVRPEPSVVRAGVMGAIAVIALLIGGRRAGPSVLGAGLIVIVILAPFLAVTWGFALSVIATGALIIGAPVMYARVEPPLRRVLRSERVSMIVAGAIAITVVAQVATAPVLLLMNTEVRLVALPANLVAMPVVPLVTIGGLLAALIGPTAPPLATVVMQITAIPASWIAGVAQWAATTRSPTIASMTGLVMVILVACAVILLLRRVRWFYVLPPALIAVILWWFPARPVYLEDWSLVMCDVGQGDGLVLRDPRGSVIVVDVGPREAGMDTCLDDLGVQQIDAVVLTHFHADHVGGLARLLDTRAVGALWATPTQDPADRAALAAIDAESHGLTIQPIRAGDSITFGSSRLDVIWPAHDIQSGSIANNASVVLLGDVGGIEVLLTGDIEPEAQEAIMARIPAIDVLVAKVPHHGSRYQHPDLPRWARAEVALISVGIGNDYGHPAEETVSAWQDAGAMILRTDVQGAVSLARRDGGLAVQTTRSAMLEPS